MRTSALARNSTWHLRWPQVTSLLNRLLGPKCSSHVGLAAWSGHGPSTSKIPIPPSLVAFQPQGGRLTMTVLLHGIGKFGPFRLADELGKDYPALARFGFAALQEGADASRHQFRLAGEHSAADVSCAGDGVATATFIGRTLARSGLAGADRSPPLTR